jgi:hypothetical protein
MTDGLSHLLNEKGEKLQKGVEKASYCKSMIIRN